MVPALDDAAPPNDSDFFLYGRHEMTSTDVRKLFWYQWDILGSTMGGDREYQEVARHAAEGRLWPVVDSVVPLSAGAEAFRRMADGAQFGKLVIEVAP